MRLFITTLISIFLYGYMPQLSAIALSGASTDGETTTTFNGSAYLSSDSNHQEKTSFYINDSIGVKFSIVPAISDRGQNVPIYIIRYNKNQWLMKNENNWEPWNLYMQSLKNAEMRILGEKEIITVDSDLTGLAGQFYYYMGYGLPSGGLVYNSQALQFEVLEEAQPITLNSLYIEDSSITIIKNGSQEIKVLGRYNDGSSHDVTSQVSFNITDTSIISINNGKIEALAKGQTTFTVNLNGIESNTVTVAVTDKVEKRLKSITLSPASFEVTVGENIALETEVHMGLRVYNISEFGFDKAVSATLVYDDDSTTTVRAVDLEIEIADTSIIKFTGVTENHVTLGYAMKIPVLSALKEGKTTVIGKLDGISSNPINITIKKETDLHSSFRDTLKDGNLGPEMVMIPAGTFRMGDIQGGGYDNEQPVHEVSVGQFAMGKYEVTFAEYDKFAEATGRNKPDDQGWGRGNRPVINVSWHDATAYAAWLSDQTGKQYRLPTEAEWEYAARAGTETKYWWGNEIGKNKANCYSDYCGDSFDYTSPVGSFAANPFGLYDTSGNVWEWTCSEYEESYKGKEKVCINENTNIYRVLRGGSWGSNPRNLRTASRSGGNPDDRGGSYGFRLVRAAWT
jgi:formylglycine-generating enzyme required for sulfatase activity